jgi:hypothetical protein
MDRINEMNVWRRAKVSALVAACRQEDGEPIEAAMNPIRLRAGQAADIGFSMSDLEFYRDRLIDRADDREIEAVRKGQTLGWMQRKVKALDEKAARLWERLRVKGGTVPLVALEADKAAAKSARADVDGMKAKITGLSGSLAAVQTEIDSYRGAAALLGDLFDSRRSHVSEAARVPGVVVAFA